MRVLFIFNHPAPYKIRLFNELAKHIDVTALFERSHNADRNPQFYETGESKFKVVPIKGLAFGNENHLSLGIVKHLKASDYDLVIMNGWHTFSEMLALRYLKKHRKSYVFYINGGIIRTKEPRLLKAIKTYFIANASAYMSPDKNSNDYLIHYGADANKIFNYPYATISNDDVLASPVTIDEKTILRASLNIKAVKLFVTCGQFIPRKNHRRLIEYWRLVPKDHVLLLIGGGKEKHMYELLLRKYDLKNVQIIDYVSKDKLFNYFRAADVCLFPTNEDIYGHVVNEAFSQGLPVIASLHANSALHLIKNGVNGYLIDFADNEQITMAIHEVLSCATMALETLKTARDNTVEIMGQRHLEIFDKLVEKS